MVKVADNKDNMSTMYHRVNDADFSFFLIYSEFGRTSAIEQLPGRLQTARGRLGAVGWQELADRCSFG